jgi:hypothetical protein
MRSSLVITTKDIDQDAECRDLWSGINALRKTDRTGRPAWNILERMVVPPTATGFDLRKDLLTIKPIDFHAHIVGPVTGLAMPMSPTGHGLARNSADYLLRARIDLQIDPSAPDQVMTGLISPIRAGLQPFDGPVSRTMMEDLDNIPVPIEGYRAYLRKVLDVEQNGYKKFPSRVVIDDYLIQNGLTYDLIRAALGKFATIANKANNIPTDADGWDDLWPMLSKIGDLITVVFSGGWPFPGGNGEYYTGLWDRIVANNPLTAFVFFFGSFLEWNFAHDSYGRILISTKHILNAIFDYWNYLQIGMLAEGSTVGEVGLALANGQGIPLSLIHGDGDNMIDLDKLSDLAVADQLKLVASNFNDLQTQFMNFLSSNPVLVPSGPTSPNVPTGPAAPSLNPPTALDMTTLFSDGNFLQFGANAGYPGVQDLSLPWVGGGQVLLPNSAAANGVLTYQGQSLQGNVIEIQWGREIHQLVKGFPQNSDQSFKPYPIRVLVAARHGYTPGLVQVTIDDPQAPNGARVIGQLSPVGESLLGNWVEQVVTFTPINNQHTIGFRNPTTNGVVHLTYLR